MVKHHTSVKTLPKKHPAAVLVFVPMKRREDRKEQRIVLGVIRQERMVLK